MGQGYTYTADQAVSKQQGQRIQLSISKRLWRRIKEVLQWSDCVRIGSRVVRICKLAIAIVQLRWPCRSTMLGVEHVLRFVATETKALQSRHRRPFLTPLATTPRSWGEKFLTLYLLR